MIRPQRGVARAPQPKPGLSADSKLLGEAESEDPNANRQRAAEELRAMVATVGRRGEPGEHIRCVVSVGMLTEGWDANNVTHILGVRAFGSQVLSEQVVGRGLRRMSYEVDPATGKLTEEDVDVYGIPFSVIPFKGKSTTNPPPEPKPKQRVRALEERSGDESRVLVVEGYAHKLDRNLIRADDGAMERLEVAPTEEPTALFVKPQVGYPVGGAGGQGPGDVTVHDRAEYYRSFHLNQIAFEIARQVTAPPVGDHATPGGNKARLRLQNRHQIFPQVLRPTLDFIDHKIDFTVDDRRELGLERYFGQVVGRLVAAIEPADSEDDPALVPLLNRYQPRGTTADVDVMTVTPCAPTRRSHVNLVQADTATWERSAAFRLEQATDVVAFYARNDGLGFAIAYEPVGVSRAYDPDFLVRTTDGSTLILKIKGHQTNEDGSKHAAAHRWVRAVNGRGEAGSRAFHVCRDPQRLAAELRCLVPDALATD